MYHIFPSPQKGKIENIRSISNEINNNNRIKELDDIITIHNNNYDVFFKFLYKNNINSDHFLNASIFEKNKYSLLKEQFLKKLKNKNLSVLEKSCIGSIL